MNFKRCALALVFVLLLCTSAFAWDTTWLDGREIVAGRALVMPAANANLRLLRANVTAQGFGMERFSLRTGERFAVGEWSGAADEVSYLLVTFDPQADHAAALAQLAALPGVREVWPDFVLHITWIPNDPLYGSQENLRQIGLERAWSRTRGAGVIVAQCDTGYRTSGMTDSAIHLLPGYDFGNHDDDPTDTEGHGTAVGNVIAEATNNHIGAAGAAPDVSLLPVKVFPDNSGGASDSDIIDGMNWAVQQNANVINLSLGAQGGGGPECSVISDAVAAGVVVVAASGNDYLGAISYPAACTDAIAVGSCNQHSEGDLPVRSDFSNYGDGLSMVAPGENIVSETFGSSGVGFYINSGTSVSCPHVTAAAALLIASKPDQHDVSQIRNALETTATRKPGTGWDVELGWGEVNVADAMVAYSGDIPNEPPVVKIMASPIQGRAPLAVTFTASASDPDGTIAHYLWSFSTGETNSVPSFVHTFKKAGDITVMVTVTDDLGASGSDQTTIHVTPGEKHSGGAKSGGCAVGGMGGVESLLFMSWSLLALARRRRRG